MPGWPTERQWVTIGTFSLDIFLLVMAVQNPILWTVEVYKVIIQAVTLTGLLNMILAFHFAANKNDETKSDNTGKAFEAITATAQANTAGGTDPEALREGDSVTLEKA